MDEWDARQLAYDISVATGALLEGLGMMSENLQRLRRGESLAYPESSFVDLIERTGMHHNAACVRWRKP
jgi:hypothetical protein